MLGLKLIQIVIYFLVMLFVVIEKKLNNALW